MNGSADENGASVTVCLDSSVLTYLTEAMAIGYDPNGDSSGLRDERVALIRIFFYVGPLYTTPTVLRETEAMSPGEKKALQQLLELTQIREVAVPDPNAIMPRVDELRDLHPDENDCWIVAEAEFGGMELLLTRDSKLLANLGPATSMQISSAFQHWQNLDILPGTAPKIQPHESNPLHSQTWWRV